MNRMTAKVAWTLSIAVLALAGASAWAQQHGTALQLQSDKKMGYITLNSDLVLNDGRLILTIGAFNKSTIPAKLEPAAIHVSTAAGKPVPLASLAQLEDETRVALGGKPQGPSPDNYQQMSTMQRPMDTTASGETDVSGYTGGDALGSTVSKPRKKTKVDPAKEAKIEEAVNNLRVAILQGVSVEPRAAAGGQVVTQAIKFGKGEERKLKMAVEFAGEQHEFEFEVPK